MNPRENRPPPQPPLSYRIFEGIFWPLMKVSHLSCRHFARLASERLDRPLSRGEKVRFTFHRIICRVCRSLPKQLENLRHLSRCCKHEREAGESAATEISEEAKLQIRNALNKEVHSNG